MSSYIPIELIWEILLPLPVKSLLRFRCVSKDFNSTIKCPNFINSHIKLSKKKRLHRLIYETENSPEAEIEHPEIHILDMNRGGCKTRVSTDQFPLLWRPWGPNLLKAHCNGLVLLGQDYFDLVVWNPATKLFRKLPNCPMTIPDNSLWDTAYGLGYDSSTNDYKVLLIMGMIREQNVKSRRVEIWIFGLKSGSWRRSQNFPSFKYKVFEDRMNGNRFADGELHFVLCHRRRKSVMPASFNLEKETFNLTPCKKNLRFQVLDGCHCVTYLNDDEVRVLLLRKKDKAKFVWTKLISTTKKQFRNRFAHGELLGFLEGDNKVIIFYDDYLHSYDIIKDRLEPIWIGGLDQVRDSKIFLSIDSLVPIG